MTIKPTSYRLKNYKMMIKSHQLFNLSRKLSSQIYFSTIWAQTPIKSSNNSLMPSMLPSMNPSRRSLFLTLFLRTECFQAIFKVITIFKNSSTLWLSRNSLSKKTICPKANPFFKKANYYWTK